MTFVYIKFCNDSTNEAMSTKTDLSDILEGRFYLFKSQSSFDS